MLHNKEKHSIFLYNYIVTNCKQGIAIYFIPDIIVSKRIIIKKY